MLYVHSVFILYPAGTHLRGVFYSGIVVLTRLNAYSTS
jgi:hypothetical protein